MVDSIKITYDDADIRDIRIEFGEEEKHLKDPVKMFCIDTLPPELNHEVEESETELVVKSNNGEATLTHILRFLYIVMKLIVKEGDKFNKPDFKVDDIDFGVVQEDIEVAMKSDYKQMTVLLDNFEVKEN